MKHWGSGWLGCALLVLACAGESDAPADAGVTRHTSYAPDSGTHSPLSESDVAGGNTDAGSERQLDPGSEARGDPSSLVPDAGSRVSDSGSMSPTFDASPKPVSDAGDAAPGDDDMRPLPKTLVPCPEQHPDYDCETSLSVFASDLEYHLDRSCGSCHQAEPGGVFPPLDRDSGQAHDAALMLTDLDDLGHSALIEVVAGGHGCADDCAEKAAALGDLLQDWQHKIYQRKYRLEQLALDRQRWQDINITSYQWHVTNGCFSCISQLSNNALAAVQDGVVQGLRVGEHFAWGLPPFRSSPTAALSWHTVDGLFDWIENAILHDADGVNIRYDELLNYPVEAVIDYDYETYDDEDYFSAGSFVPLDSGFCVGAGPFAFDAAEMALTRCSSTAECAGCSPMVDPGFYCPVDLKCGGGCPVGSVCVAVEDRCTSFECVPACTADFCGASYSCEVDGQCRPRSCVDDSSLCFTPELCQPADPIADVFGCSPPTCNETEVGCVPACTSDQDCGCGSCVNGRCSATPGVCH